MELCRIFENPDGTLFIEMTDCLDAEEMETVAAALLKAISLRGASVFGALQMVDDVVPVRSFDASVN